MFIVFAIIGGILCANYLSLEENSFDRKRWEFIWMSPGLIYAVLFCILNPDKWNYHETTSWAIRGDITRGPLFQLLAVIFGNLILISTTSYLLGRIFKFFLDKYKKSK